MRVAEANAMGMSRDVAREEAGFKDLLPLCLRNLKK